MTDKSISHVVLRKTKKEVKTRKNETKAEILGNPWSAGGAAWLLSGLRVGSYAVSSECCVRAILVNELMTSYEGVSARNSLRSNP